MLEQRIQQHFIDSADLKYQAAQALGKPIADAVQAVLACITSGGKILACGNGPSVASNTKWGSSTNRQAATCCSPQPPMT